MAGGKQSPAHRRCAPPLHKGALGEVLHIYGVYVLGVAQQLPTRGNLGECCVGRCCRNIILHLPFAKGEVPPQHILCLPFLGKGRCRRRRRRGSILSSIIHLLCQSQNKKPAELKCSSAGFLPFSSLYHIGRIAQKAPWKASSRWARKSRFRWFPAQWRKEKLPEIPEAANL